MRNMIASLLLCVAAICSGCSSTKYGLEAEPFQAEVEEAYFWVVDRLAAAGAPVNYRPPHTIVKFQEGTSRSCARDICGWGFSAKGTPTADITVGKQVTLPLHNGTWQSKEWGGVGLIHRAIAGPDNETSDYEWARKAGLMK